MLEPTESRALTLSFGGALLLASAPALAQESASIFDAPQVRIDWNDRPFRALFDYDGDGDLDVLGVDLGSAGNIVYSGVYENPGDGAIPSFMQWTQFSYPEYLPNGNSDALHVAVGDLDGDGDPDYAFAAQSTVFTVRLENKSPDVPSILHQGLEVRSIATADLDNTGPDELIVQAEGEVRVLSNDVAWPGKLAIVAPAGKLVLRPLDADGDAWVDLLIACEDEREVRLYHGTGSPAAPFGNETVFFHDVEHAMVDVGDVDGDGDDDAAIFGMGGSFRILRQGPGGFALEAALPGGPAEFLFDVDGDGDLDGACCGGGGAPPPLPLTQPSDFEIAINDGAGNFAPAFKIPGLGSRQLGGVADMDGDGDPDLVAGRCIYFSRGDIKDSWWAGAPAGHDPAGPFPFDANEIYDHDLDGDLDRFVGLDGLTAGLGDGSVEPRALPHAAAPAGTQFVGPGYPGDWDGDGDPDLLVEHRTDGGGLLGMRLLANAGGGFYADGGPASAGALSFSLGSLAARDCLAADIDGDGDLDLATRMPLTVGGPLSTSVWENDGSGQFAHAISYPGEHLLHVDDFNADGTQDLIFMVVHPDDPEFDMVNARLGLPGGVIGPLFDPLFQPVPFKGRENVPVAFGSYTSGDSKPDIVVTNGSVTWLYFNAGGPTPGSLVCSLGSVNALYNVDESGWLHALDVDFDGHLDVVGGPQTDLPRSTGVAFRDDPVNPFLEFSPGMTHITGGGAPADVDGDGDIDLVGEWLVQGVVTTAEQAGSRRQYGVATAGTGGAEPILGAHGGSALGTSARLSLTNAVGGALTAFAVGFSEAYQPNTPFAGVTAHLPTVPLPVIVPIAAGGAAGEVGAGSWDLNYLVSPSWIGLAAYHQAFVFDAGAPSFLSASNGLEIIYGQ